MPKEKPLLRKKETKSDHDAAALKKHIAKPIAAKSAKRAAGPSSHHRVKRNAKVKEERTATATEPSPLDEYSTRLHSVVMIQGGKGSDMVG